MKKLSWIILFGLMVLLTASAIYLFSAQDGLASSRTSGSLTLLLVRAFRPDYDSLDAARRQALFDAWHNAVRTFAHCAEYTVLGVFLLLFFHALQCRLKAPLSWLAGALYACTDEWHQMFVGQRAASWQDVGINSAGVLLGVLLALLILRLPGKKQRPASDAGTTAEPPETP